MSSVSPFFVFFFFNDTATTEIYTLSLHDALPICPCSAGSAPAAVPAAAARSGTAAGSRTSGSASSGPARAPRPSGRASGSSREDRKSTRLNSSHGYISYAVFCLKKKKKDTKKHSVDDKYPKVV